jgi:dihydrodipicolinate synthase/N-acetylneuraminate lyase
MTADTYDRLWATIVIPYQVGSYDIDEEGLRGLVRYFLNPAFVAAGGALVVNSVAGEIYNLSYEEKKRLVEIVVGETKGQVPVIGGVGDFTPEGCARIASDARDAGAEGLFLMPPVGGPEVSRSWNAERDPEVWIDLAREVCDAVDLPVLAHPSVRNTPEWGHGLPLSATLKMLDAVPQIIGWKMTYGRPGYVKLARALRQYPRHVSILTAHAAMQHELFALGLVDGTATGAWNYALEPMLEHGAAWREGDATQAREIWDRGLAELQEFVAVDGRLHVRYKLAAWIRGLIGSPFMRPPNPKPSIDEALELRRRLAATGLTVRPEEEIRDTVQHRA